LRWRTGPPAPDHSQGTREGDRPPGGCPRRWPGARRGHRGQSPQRMPPLPRPARADRAVVAPAAGSR
jgi:hypothetical protein